VRRRHIALALLFVVAVAGAASIYALTAAKRYDATARVVVHPIPASATTFTGIDVLRSSGDTSRDLGTAAHFFDTPEVVSATATRLSLSPSEVSRSLDIRPLAGSNILLIVGKAASPQPAAQIANGIVQEAIAERTARVQAQVSAILNKLSTSSSTEARRRAIDLQALQNRPDPTLETLSAATAPSSPAWPKPVRMISEATLAAVAVAALFLFLTSLLRALSTRAHAPVPDHGMDDREQALEHRAAAIDQRERELQQVLKDAKKASDATSKASALLEKRVAAVSTRERALAKDSAQLARAERALAEREAAMQAREAASQARETAFEEREAAFEEREAVFEEQVAESQKEPEPEPVPEPAPLPTQPDLVADSHKVIEPVQVNARPGGWTIQVLERLVAERGEQFPDQVEEWRYYVHFLREHADVDGGLPASFDYLIEDTFAELL
jgi:capsular polysaccharide biosynthesis protein